MTDQELLQQAKDQVAKTRDQKNWTEWYKNVVIKHGYEGIPSMIMDEVCISAIQSAREEAAKEINSLKSKIGNMKASLKKYQRNED